MHSKYGEFSQSQIQDVKRGIRKNIIFLLAIADPKLKEEYKHINVNAAFDSLLNELSGMNSLLNNPPEIVTIMSLLESALLEYNSSYFDFSRYRKMILDACAKVNFIKEVDHESDS